MCCFFVGTREEGSEGEERLREGKGDERAGLLAECHMKPLLNHTLLTIALLEPNTTGMIQLPVYLANV